MLTALDAVFYHLRHLDMENKDRLTPISDVWWKSNRMKLNIPFPPWVEDESIGVDLERTKRLMNLGGIRFTRVDLLKDGDKTASMPTTVGIAPDGSAYAGKIAASERVPTYEYDQYADDSRVLLQNALWTNLQISLNLEEMKDRITDGGNNVREAESWTPHLDTALREGIRKGGTNHLLRGHNKLSVFMALYINVHNILMDAANINLFDVLAGSKPKIPTAGDLLIETGIEFVVWSLIASLLIYGKENKKEGSGYRISLFPGYEIDRAVVLQLLSRTLPLVETIDSDQDLLR